MEIMRYPEAKRFREAVEQVLWREWRGKQEALDGGVVDARDKRVDRRRAPVMWTGV